MDIQILYEDQDLAVIHKPPGIVVNKTQTSHEESVQSWWAAKNTVAFPADWEALIPKDWTDEFGSAEQIFAERQGIVHRLDKETSGVMLLAKHPGSLINLLMQFRLRQTSKTYICLVHGKFSVLSDTVSFPVGRSSFDRVKFQVAADGRPSETTYRVLKTFTQFKTMTLIDQLKAEEKNTGRLQRKLERGYQGFSLVECQPKTGRTHQIRVHMTHLHHPLVADPIYVGSKRLSLDQLWCSRLFLHAASLSWNDVRTGEVRTMTAELPEDLQHALTYLEEKPGDER